MHILRVTLDLPLYVRTLKPSRHIFGHNKLAETLCQARAEVARHLFDLHWKLPGLSRGQNGLPRGGPAATLLPRCDSTEDDVRRRKQKKHEKDELMVNCVRTPLSPFGD